MLLLDRVIEISEDGKKVIGLKNVSANEPFFQGHFPGLPVMPGVLILEAMAQCAAILFLKDLPDRETKVFYFGAVDRARFRKPVMPGDQLLLEIELLARRSNTVKVHGVARVDGAVVAEADLLSVMADRPK